MNKTQQENLEMEHSAPPPPPKPGPHDPKPARAIDKERLVKKLVVQRSIAGAAALYENLCSGGDNGAYENNCAHFLSNAFINAGFTEIGGRHHCIEARCQTNAKRPIRARDMWCWFKEMSTESREVLPKEEGLWAVFQINEAEYWGGHVVIIDTDSNKFYGTANYFRWKQSAYRW